ncbi:MAG: tetratricopeptide repeat protein, partial [Candidatus Omnitrophica bacterium]|nr:tetratricopeptide repeat protein [Candidatus Omnitrophota bacterium]
MIMLKKLAICILVLFIPLIISAEELSESESFLAAKAVYDDSSYGDSLNLFNKFIIDFPKSPAIPEAKLYIAQSFFQDNKFIEARETLNNLEKSYVPFAIEDKFLFLSGQVYLRAKDFKEAARYFKKLIETHPDSALLVNAKMQLGWVLFQDGKYQEAEKVFDLLTKSDDLNIQEEALFKKGEALFFAKDYTKSLESYNAFLKIFPKSDKLARAYFYMAEANFYLEDLPGAVDYYAQALKSARDDDPTKISALQGLGWSYLKQNKLSQAEENFLKIEKIKDVDFNKENFLFGMASLYYQLAKFDKAVIYYDELINRYPNSELFIQALFGKGQCLVGLSNYDQAIVLYDKAIEKCLESTSPQAKD